MNILLVYPKNPDTYWNFKHVIKFISKKSSNIPLGLITVASLLPASWKKRLTDMNISRLRDKDIKWADYVFISAISVQMASVEIIIRRCKQLNAPPLSRLYQRLEKEGRLADNFTGDNTDFSMNFIPVMDKKELLRGYKEIIRNIYSSKSYYETHMIDQNHKHG